MKLIRIFTTVAFILSCSAAFSESPVEMGTRLMKAERRPAVFEKIKAKGTLTIYDSSGEVKFTKSLIMGTYTTGMGSPQRLPRNTSPI